MWHRFRGREIFWDSWRLPEVVGDEHELHETKSSSRIQFLGPERKFLRPKKCWILDPSVNPTFALRHGPTRHCVLSRGWGVAEGATEIHHEWIRGMEWMADYKPTNLPTSIMNDSEEWWGARVALWFALMFFGCTQTHPDAHNSLFAIFYCKKNTTPCDGAGFSLFRYGCRGAESDLLQWRDADGALE